MKKFFILTSLFILNGYTYAQTTPSSTENYVYTKSYLTYPSPSDQNQNPKTSESVQYFDGIGRPKQVVNVKVTPLGKDLVTTIPYDGLGRNADSWLPVPMNTLNGAIQSGVDVQGISYYSDSKPFVHKILENSPLDRVYSLLQPGTQWQAHPIEFKYETNFNDGVKVLVTSTSWQNGTMRSIVKTSDQLNYANTKLSKNTLTDEDGNKTIEFRNGDGQVILIRKVLESGKNADTYYVYNEYNLLAFIIPPQASFVFLDGAGNNAEIPDNILNNLCYQYRYDSRNRMVEKKLPNKGWEYMVFDKQDRLVLTQDALMGSAKKWLFTKYDEFGRIVMTGIYSSPYNYGSTGRASEQVNVDTKGSNNTLRSATSGTVGFTNSGMDVYYYNTASTYPNSIEKLLSIMYYDTYPLYSFNPNFPSGSITDNSALNQVSTRGLPVMTFVKNIEDDNWTKNYNYYDDKGRIIGSHSINSLGGYTKTEFKLDFSGSPKQSITRHKRLDTDTERVITETFEYDNQNRLLVHKHQVDSNPVEILTQNKYTELSQLESKKVGGVNVANPLQIMDYKYNIRGWLTKVNDPTNLNGKLFGYEIKYNNPVNTQSVGKFNGNITEIDWNNGSENLLKRYNYEYDKLNMLVNAFYREPSTGNTGYFDEYLSYDLNGNIMTLKRNAPPISTGTTFTQVDDLTYQYTGNRLDKVIEISTNDTGYEGGNNIIDYDLNGNMTNMKDKGIQSIIYNYLNLPNSYSISQNSPLGVVSGFALNYIYRADGTKFRKVYKSEGGKGSTMITTNMTDYLDGFQYQHSEVSTCLWCRTSVAYEQEAFKNESDINALKPIQAVWKLDFVPTAEGYYSFTENRYIYQYRDHLGNARVSFAKSSTGTLEITDTNNYYAFGMNHIGINKGLLGSYMNYKYNGKELQETGMYDYGARLYMPDLGRWGVVDPLAEKFVNWSSYNYAMNNPLRFIDPNGMDIIEVKGGYKYTEEHAVDVFNLIKASVDSKSGKRQGSIGIITFGKEKVWGEAMKFAVPESIMANVPAGKGQGGYGDFYNALKSISDQSPDGIGFLGVFSHGGRDRGNRPTNGEGMIFANADLHRDADNVYTSDLSKLGRSVDSGDIKFADFSTVYLGACNASTAYVSTNFPNGQSFALEFAKATRGAFVWGAANEHMNAVNPNNPRNTKFYPERGGTLMINYWPRWSPTGQTVKAREQIVDVVELSKIYRR
ncbi:DUF6443 domain-containing protein [Chryseobacterium sp. 22543]|uniref:DUF6443 domain-containing protein n=1 Tax=Chryseobacterium sp. 22543 TaxID=3453940 RepID=UPI003F87B8E9